MLAAVLASLALLNARHTQDSPPAVAGFRYQPGRITAGRVHRYRKSNRDGSNPSEIALYLASETRLEALKWGAGEPEATLVVAEMDWETCSVGSFHTYHVDEHGERTLKAALTTSPDRKRIDVQLGDQKLGCALERFPWHSYDFDFASLNVALRFLGDPTGETEFTILDFLYEKKPPEFGSKGSVVLAYEGEEEHAGQLCRRYVLDGPGLEERGGSLWAAKGDEVFLVAFEIEQPDEPGMSSGKLEWLRNESMAPNEWEAFVRERKDPGPR